MTLGGELSEGLKLSFMALMANKARAVLTMLGIIIGIISVTLMGAAIEGLTRAFNSSIASIGADVLYVQKWPWMDNSGEWWKFRNRKDLEIDYAEKIKKDATLLAAVAPIVGRIGTLKFQNMTANNVEVEGTTSDFMYVSKMEFTDGRFFTDEESRGNRPVAVIGSDVADQLFPNREPVGQHIKVNGLSFRVIGVRSKEGSFMGMFSLDNLVIIPVGQFQDISGNHFPPSA